MTVAKKFTHCTGETCVYCKVFEFIQVQRQRDGTVDQACKGGFKHHGEFDLSDQKNSGGSEGQVCRPKLVQNS